MVEIELPNPEELEEKRRNSFSKKVALFTAIYAVILAICALGGNNSMKEMLLAQQEASNQWAFYQAKTIREYLYRIERDRLETHIVERGATMQPKVLKHYKAEIQKVSTEEARLSKEKHIISVEAKKQEHERDVNRAKDPYFDFGEVLLQIAIVMSSVSIIPNSRPEFFLPMGAPLPGSWLKFNAFRFLFEVPFRI